MFHTFTIQYQLLPKACSCLLASVNSDYFNRYPPDSEEYKNFINTIIQFPFSNGGSRCLRSRRLLRRNHPGIENIVFVKAENQFKQTVIYLRITINPAVLITGSYTVDNLYYATYENNELLQDCYALHVYQLFPILHDFSPPFEELYSSADDYTSTLTAMGDCFQLGSIPYMALSKIKRIDFSVNLHPENPQLFLELAKKTYYDGRKQTIDFKNNNLWARNKSRKICLYDKAQKMNSNRYRGLPGIDTIRQEAAGIVRYEVSLTRFPSENIPKLCFITIPTWLPFKFGPFPYLNETVSANILTSEYQHIGYQDWFNDHYFTKAINNAGLNPNMKRKLLLTAYLISQCRSISAAYNKSEDYALAKTGETININKKRLNIYITKIRDIGIQPLRIPDRRKVPSMQNPYPIKIESQKHTPSSSNEIGISRELSENYKFFKTKISNLYNSLQPSNHAASA